MIIMYVAIFHFFLCKQSQCIFISISIYKHLGISKLINIYMATWLLCEHFTVIQYCSLILHLQ